MEEANEAARRRIKIGSQRDPAAYRRKRDWTPLVEPEAPREVPPPTAAKPSAPSPPPPVVKAVAPPVAEVVHVPPPVLRAAAPAAAEPMDMSLPRAGEPFGRDVDADLNMALSDTAFDALMSGSESMSSQEALEPESRQKGRVVAVRREEVFVELGGREQGCVPVRQFELPPKPGDVIDVIVQRLNADDGLYDLRLPTASAEVADWGDLNQGMMVQAQITGHNTGGLECEVNHIRGFIPVSQIALYRTEDMSQFVGQQMDCLITEANPMRRNLVLSRRAVLEREQEEAREKLLASIEPGQVYEGVVRKLMDFGAFVDLGSGVDGLVHVSQLAWSRVNHPREVLQEGQHIQVRIEKVDRESGRIGLSYRELLENPWTGAAGKYPPHSVVPGKVTKLMEFGAFVELEPGVEGLIHISELSPKRVWRASDVVHEGDQVEVMVLSVDTQAQRISLSLKALAKPEPTKTEKEAAEAEAAVPAPSKQKVRHEPLQGGLGKASGGEQFGLNW